MDIIVDETEIIPYEIFRRYISGKEEIILKILEKRILQCNDCIYKIKSCDSIFIFYVIM